MSKAKLFKGDILVASSVQNESGRVIMSSRSFRFDLYTCDQSWKEDIYHILIRLLLVVFNNVHAAVSSTVFLTLLDLRLALLRFGVYAFTGYMRCTTVSIL